MAMKNDEVIQFVKENEEKALEITNEILGKGTTMQSFNGIVGGKNATYDVDALAFDTPEGYVEAWLNSHWQRFSDEKYAPYEKSSHRVHKLLKNPFLKQYIKNYLARTYFKKHN
ncbi:topoisomerase [Bacillus altitudinis]|uniref:topoisomerase n=1 Tax=Bacillus altitudinis TaxID=293387 RepID=UPI002280EB5F|nr:topoisomerase [Bacillus altitudinis]MCY7716967.1 topoisomerase [Bacillus altitudinis]